MTDRDNALALRGRNRDEFALAMDADEQRSMLSTKDQSVLGLSHGLCEHNRTAATCPQCIYSDRGNKVLIDMGAMEYAERVHHQAASGIKQDPVRVAEGAFRAGAAAGIAMQKDVKVALSVESLRNENMTISDEAAIGTLVALANGQISRVDALKAMNRWAESAMKELQAEADPHGRRALAAGRFTGDVLPE